MWQRFFNITLYIDTPASASIAISFFDALLLIQSIQAPNRSFLLRKTPKYFACGDSRTVWFSRWKDFSTRISSSFYLLCLIGSLKCTSSYFLRLKMEAYYLNQRTARLYALLSTRQFTIANSLIARTKASLIYIVVDTFSYRLLHTSIRSALQNRYRIDESREPYNILFSRETNSIVSSSSLSVTRIILR